MILVSYRVGDAEITTGRVFGYLEHHFRSFAQLLPAQEAPALDLLLRVEADVRQCDALVVLMGEHWLRDADHRRRFDRGTDSVRVAIEAAMRNRKIIFPVVIDGGRHPAGYDLPPTLRPYSRYEPIYLRSEHFAFDVRGLVHRIRDAVTEAGADRAPTEIVRPDQFTHSPPTRPAARTTSAADARRPPRPEHPSRPSNPSGQRVAASRALLIVGHDTIVDVVKKRHGSQLMQKIDEPDA